MYKHSVSILSGLLLTTSATLAHEWESSRPDSHAPISVIGDHTHEKGEFMGSYRFMRMSMKGLLDGSEKVSTSEALGSYGYKKVPTQMTMDMHMLGGMYASSDKLTWMVMLPYLENDMDMQMGMGMGMNSNMSMSSSMPMNNNMTMKMKSSGIGDVKVGGLYNVFNQNGHKVHVNLALSLPTGSIDETNKMGGLLGYKMQLGSGTFDVLPGVTYAAQNAYMSWGSQLMTTLRLGENDRDYTLGNRYKLQGWVQKPIFNQLSVSARLAYEDMDNVDQKNGMMQFGSPVLDPNKQGGSLLTAGLGANLTLAHGNRLAFEYTTEIEQDLDGPQMAFEDSFVLAWQMTW